jgi:formate-dependent nitrite reductase cytochrome c552 subunit
MSHYTPGHVTRAHLTALLPAGVLAGVLAALPAPARAGDRVGAETCKACHPAAYEIWAAGPHARALEGLPERSRKDRRCLSCHAPDAEEGVAAVSCETCHGPGRLYVAPYVMRDPELARALGLVELSEKSCATCHGESAPSLVRFDAKKKMALVDHWSRERRGDAPATPSARPGPAAKER